MSSGVPTRGPAEDLPRSPKQSLVGAFALMTLLGGILLVAGSFMPWINYSTPYAGEVSRNGLDGGGDGVVDLVIGLVVLLIGAARLLSLVRPVIQWISILLGGFAVWWSVNDLSVVHDKVFQSDNGYAIAAPASMY